MGCSPSSGRDSATEMPAIIIKKPLRQVPSHLPINASKCSPPSATAAPGCGRTGWRGAWTSAGQSPAGSSGASPVGTPHPSVAGPASLCTHASCHPAPALACWCRDPAPGDTHTLVRVWSGWEWQWVWAGWEWVHVSGEWTNEWIFY